jgi:hypothetical protein
MKHFTVAEFWAQQTFAHLETYSFNRGPTSTELLESLQAELAQTKLEQQKARYMNQAKIARKLRQLEIAIQGGEYGVTLSEPKAISNSTARKIAVLPQGSALVEQLSKLLRKASKQEAFAICPPVYRDALVFNNAEGQRIAVLNICFECSLMATDAHETVEADFATYDALRAFLVGLGHPIETLGI